MRAAFVVTSLALFASLASAQVIQKWKAPDGSLYFGDKPPAGSTKIGEEGSAAPAAPAPAAAASDDAFSANASNARTRIENALKDDSTHLEEIHEQIENVGNIQPQGDPNRIATQQDVADVQNFQSKKNEALRQLRAKERKTYADIAGLWKAFDKLNADVVEHYGREPDWWRSRIDCGCPTRAEAERALR